MATAIIKPISNEEVAKAQIEGNLPDKPSQATLYGGKVLTPQEIKAWYDKLPKLIVEYYNNLIKAIPGIEEGEISENSLAAKILTNIMENHSLKDLLEDITSGAFADYLTVTGDVKLTGFLEKVLARINTFGPEAPSGEAELGNLYAEVKEYGIKALYMYVGKWAKLWSGPSIRINSATHEWEVSYDNGESWQSLDTQAEPRSVYLSSEEGLGLPYSHYQISAVTVPSGMSLKNGDIIIFTNSTFAMAYSVGELNSEEYSCSVAKSFKGETGASGYSVHYANVSTELTTTIIADTAFTNNTYNPIKAGDVCVSANGMIFVIGERYSSVGWNVTAKSSIGYSVHYSTYEATSETTEIPQSSISDALNPSIKTNDICITPNGLMFRIGTKKDAFTWNVSYLSSIKGNPFRVTKTFASVEEMEADASIPEGSFVVISTGNVEDEENARLYVRTLAGYSFITDMSGAKGIQGPQGVQGIQGEKGDKGDKGDGIPTVTEADDGKFLRVRDGVVVAEDTRYTLNGTYAMKNEINLNPYYGLTENVSFKIYNGSTVADKIEVDGTHIYAYVQGDKIEIYDSDSRYWDGGFYDLSFDDVQVSEQLYRFITDNGGDPISRELIDDVDWKVGQIDTTVQNHTTSLEKNTSDIEKHSVTLTYHDKRITNMEKGLPSDRFVTDGSIAYVKDVPADVLPSAGVLKIGGRTVKDGDTLKSAKVTAIESVGANASDISTPESGYFASSTGVASSADSGYIRFLVLDVNPNTTYTLKSNLIVHSIWEDDGKNPIQVKVWGASAGVTITTTANTRRIRVTLQNTSGAADTTAFEWFMINYGTEAKVYVPYSGKHTLELPEAAQVENGTDANCYDYIEWSENGARLKHIKVGVVDMGTLNWGLSSGAVNKTYSAKVAGIRLPTELAERDKGILCAKYSNAASDTSKMENKTMQRHPTGFIYICDADYADAASLKAALSGVMLYYELAEPIVTDISDILTIDNLIEVEGGGTITFVNENAIAIPSTITYQVKEG